MSIFNSVCLSVLVAFCMGCSEKPGSFWGKCSKSPALASLLETHMLALKDGTERSQKDCAASGMDCSRLVRVMHNGNIAVFIDIAEWNNKTGKCQPELGSLAVYEYEPNGTFLRELLAI